MFNIGILRTNSGVLRTNASMPLCGALIGAFLVSAPASAQFRRNANNDVIVYVDADFHGANQTLRGDVADLRPSGLNDKISSIRIPAGQTWEVCQDINYGICETLSGSVADLRTIGWNDRISSLRRVEGAFRNGDFRDSRSNDVFAQPQPSQGLVFYDLPGYRGATYDQGSVGNRAARSVEVRGGTWQLCDRAGHCTTISQSVPDLSRLGLNGQITSVRPVDNSRGDDERRDPRGR